MTDTLRRIALAVLLMGMGIGAGVVAAAAATTPAPTVPDPAPTAVTTTVVAPRATITLNADEKTLLDLINRARARRGLARLKFQGALERAARAHSADMIAHDYFSHLSRGGGSLAARLQRFGYKRSGYSSWSCGEVIGWGQGLAGGPRAIFRMWMRSAGHRCVILGKAWRDIGVGRAKGTFQGRSGVRMYTVDFGHRSG